MRYRCGWGTPLTGQIGLSQSQMSTRSNTWWSGPSLLKNFSPLLLLRSGSVCSTQHRCIAFVLKPCKQGRQDPPQELKTLFKLRKGPNKDWRNFALPERWMQYQCHLLAVPASQIQILVLSSRRSVVGGIELCSRGMAGVLSRTHAQAVPVDVI